jgi:hypothetical protein
MRLVALVVIVLLTVTTPGDAPGKTLASPPLASASPNAGAVIQFGEPSPATPAVPTSPTTSGLLTRADAIAKASLPSGNTITRVEAKLVLRSDLTATGHGLGAVGEADYVWAVAQWGQVEVGRRGGPLGSAARQPLAQPYGWRFLLIDARTGDAYAGGLGSVEATWWTGLPDRFTEVIR